MTRTAFIAALFASLAAAAPATSFAAPAGRTAVSYADLDLSRPADVARLRRRIATALEEFCGSYATVESSNDYEISRCRAEALASAESQLASILNRIVRVAQADAVHAAR